MVACFKPQKSPLDFVRAAAKVAPDFPQARFLMVGDGVLRSQVEKERKRLNLVGATGRSPLLILAGWRRDIPAILAASQVVILTSRWEGLPVTLLEAMASRKPIVATAIGGTPEIVRDGENGFLSPAGDVEAIARSIRRLLENPDLAAAMGECGKKQLSADYEVTETVRRLENLYEELHSSIPCLTSPF
jgi:glycosyltransferase involved in cell wall biosynthesis